MKKVLVLCFSLAFFAAHADEISLEDFARHALFLDVKISPTGRYLATTMRNQEDNIQLVVLDRTKNLEVVSQQYFTGRNSIGNFNWVSDERLIITPVREIGSLESPVSSGEIFAMNADGSRRIMLFGPRSESRDRAFASIIYLLPDDPQHILISSNPYRSAGTHATAYRLNISNGRKRRVATAPMRQTSFIADSQGEIRLAVGEDEDNNNEIVLMHREGRNTEWQEIQRGLEEDGIFDPLVFLADSHLVLGLSDTQSDTKAVSVLDLTTKKESILYYEENVNVTPIFSLKAGNTDQVIGAYSQYLDHDYVFFEAQIQSDFSGYIQSLAEAFPGRTLNINSATRDNRFMVLTVSSANHPTEFFLFDSQEYQVSYLLNSSPWLKPDLLAQTTAITYQSRDDTTIQAILTLPNNSENKKLPLIMLPHGGPHGVRDTLRLDLDAKVLAQHGYAVLQPNFRGSGGFGRSFQQAGYRNWGTLMIDDMTDGVKHLIEQGIADPDRVCAYGASYGGYAALKSAIREPDLYQCTVGFVGVFDLNLMYTDGDIPERRSGITYLEKVLGRSPEVLDLQSPVHQIDKLKAPVLIIHGTEDLRVPMIQAERLRDALEKKGHPYEWLVKEKEGHGFYSPANNVERWQTMLNFFNRYIGEPQS